MDEVISARALIMGVRHRERFVEGVQFHPESILTPAGGRIIERVLASVARRER